MPIYSSDSEDDTILRSKLFGRQKAIHAVLGGGQVADVLLWRDKRTSAYIAIGLTVIWFLFEAVGYNFVTLFSHICITAMLIAFIWCRGAELFHWKIPEFPRSLWDKSNFLQVASALHTKINEGISNLAHIAYGKDPALFVLAIGTLYILSVIGNYFTCLNFIYFSYMFLQVVPFLYEMYEDQVEYVANKLLRELRKGYRQFDKSVLNKIPRGPGKEKKIR